MRIISEYGRCFMPSQSWAPSFGLGLTGCFGTRSRLNSFGLRDQECLGVIFFAGFFLYLGLSDRRTKD
jgi:hypothetical protein